MAKKECSRPDIAEKLLQFKDNKLDAEEKDMVSRHINDCETCAEMLHSMQALECALKGNPGVFTGEYHASECVPPDMLVRFAEDRKQVPPTARQEIEKHLALCGQCRYEVECLEQLEKDAQQHFQENVQISGDLEFLNLVSDEYPFSGTGSVGWLNRLRSELREWYETAIEWLRECVSWHPAPVMVRSRTKRTQEHIQVLRRRAKGLHIRVETEKIDAQYAEMLIFIDSAHGQSVPGELSASLFAGESEIASLCIEKGRALFRRIPCGTYRLELFKSGSLIKTIHVTAE